MTATDPIADLLSTPTSQVLADDTALKAKLTDLAHLALAEAEKMLRTGTPSARRDVIKVFGPVFVKALADDQTDSRIEDLRIAVGQLYADYRGNIGGAIPATAVVYPEPMPDTPPDDTPANPDAPAEPEPSA